MGHTWLNAACCEQPVIHIQRFLYLNASFAANYPRRATKCWVHIILHSKYLCSACPLPIPDVPRLLLTQALSDVLDVLSSSSSSSEDGSSSSSPAPWWLSACAAVGQLLLLLAATVVSPAAAGGSSGSNGGGSCCPVLLLLWRLGGEMCPGLWRSDVLALGWLLLCVTSQQVCGVVKTTG
jgi:hypothetical protein